MTMFTSRELAQLRADLVDLLPDTCTVQRATETTDDAGHSDASWSAVASNVACRVDPYTNRTNQDDLTAGREAGRAYYQLTVLYDTTLDDGDRVVYAGETMEVLQLYGIHSLKATKRALLAKVAGE